MDKFTYHINNILLKNIARFTIIFLSIFLLFINLSYSMENDDNAPLELQADSADINQTKHIGIYTGNVEFDQGSTHIRAKKAITKNNEKNQLTKAIIIGDKLNQAHYWTKVSFNKPELHAYADRIYYFPKEHIIKLKGNAKVKQGNNYFSAPVIVYDMLKQHVFSEKSPDNSGRTVIIFNPKEKNNG